MSEGAAKRARWARLSRRAFLAASLASLAVCLVALVWLFRHRASRPAPAAGRSVPATVTVEQVDLRREPSTTSPTVGTLARGTRLEVLADAGLWVEVRAGNARGFLPAETLERDSDREVRSRRAGTILAFAPVSGVVVEDTDLLLAPFPMAARAGRLEKGTTVRIHSVDHAYFALRGPDGGLAFIDSAKVDVIPPDPARPTISPARERALKNLEVTDLEQLPLTPGEASPPDEDLPSPAAGSAAPAPPLAEEPAEPALLLSRVDPTYPETARRVGAEGTVVLDVTIGADGRVVKVDVVRPLPYGLSEAAAGAVKRWQYRPARGRSGPILSRKEVRIQFRLRS